MTSASPTLRQYWKKSNGEVFTVQYPDEWVKVMPDEKEKFLDKLESQCGRLKIGGKKPADNVEPKFEPKFKVGDWIVANDGINTNNGTNTFLITNINCDHCSSGDVGIISIYCALEDTEGVTHYPCLLSENFFHPWTIEDAEDGDVLVDEDNNIGIYKENDDLNWSSYIYLGCDNRLRGFSIGGYHTHKNTRPATKEQRDLLFSKMKDAGYEWVKQEAKDNVKPKFKAGDWIVCDGIDSAAKITGIDADSYEAEFFDGSTRFSDIGFVDRNFRPWTVEDAKDGDVLAFYSEYKGNKTEQVGIIEKYVGRHGGCSNSFSIYAGVDWENNLQMGGYMGSSDIQPATKEQRDLLFQKMKDSGYEWDAEKKELNNIVEPKFKIGDWVIGRATENEPRQIAEITKDGYKTTYGGWIGLSFEEDMRLWTVQDAKDGDVLVNHNDEVPFIFKGFLDKGHPNYPVAYCGINDVGKFKICSGDYFWEDSNVKPATKEQREFLFSKMREAGYEWDAENKSFRQLL